MHPFAYRDHDALGALDEASREQLCRTVIRQAAQLLKTDNPQERVILRLPSAGDDIAGLKAMMDPLLVDAADLVFLGVGGSSLGGQALAQLKGWGTPAYALSSSRPRLHFLDNLDASTSRDFFRDLEMEGARFVVISKSGNTLETLVQCLVVLNCLRDRGIGDFHERFAFVVGPGESPLRRLAERLGAPLCDHDPMLGGRYSVLSVTGALVLLATGGQVAAMHAGAEHVLQNLREDVSRHETSDRNVMSGEKFSTPILGAMAAIGLTRAGYDTGVMLSYGDRLQVLGQWHRQLWMESLGKDGNCASLVCGLGPVDQHSQLQAWLEGRQVNWFTLLCASTEDTAPRIHSEEWGMSDALPFLQGRSLGDIVDAQMRATADVLVANSAPLRRLELHTLDEFALGGVFMHFILETILTAKALGIDPFNQPAVERAKRATIKRLQC